MLLRTLLLVATATLPGLLAQDADSAPDPWIELRHLVGGEWGLEGRELVRQYSTGPGGHCVLVLTGSPAPPTSQDAKPAPRSAATGIGLYYRDPGDRSVRSLAIASNASVYAGHLQLEEGDRLVHKITQTADDAQGTRTFDVLERSTKDGADALDWGLFIVTPTGVAPGLEGRFQRSRPEQPMPWLSGAESPKPSRELKPLAELLGTWLAPDGSGFSLDPVAGGRALLHQAFRTVDEARQTTSHGLVYWNATDKQLAWLSVDDAGTLSSGHATETLLGAEFSLTRTARTADTTSVRLRLTPKDEATLRVLEFPTGSSPDTKPLVDLELKRLADGDER